MYQISSHVWNWRPYISRLKWLAVTSRRKASLDEVWYIIYHGSIECCGLSTWCASISHGVIHFHYGLTKPPHGVTKQQMSSIIPALHFYTICNVCCYKVRPLTYYLYNKIYEHALFLINWNWGRMAHIRVGKLTIIGSDNGLSPGRSQAII